MLKYTGMNMFKPVKAKTAQEYLDSVPPERREIIDFMHSFIQKTAPSLEPHLAYNMLGYGKFKYENYKKEVIDWPVVALANQKDYVSIYVCALDGGEYIAEKYKDRLGKVSVGKSCIRLKKLEDVDISVLKKVIQASAHKPGLA